MPTADTLSRCRHCGAELAGEKGHRSCPRCHPEKIRLNRTQLDLFTNATAVARPTPATPPALESVAVAPPQIADTVVRRRPSLLHAFVVALGTLVLGAGSAWSIYQLWPRGAVEQSIVASLAALPHFTERTGAENPFAAIRVEAESGPAFADLNGDGAPDLILGSRSGEIRVFLNRGTAKHPRFGAASADTFGLVATDTSGVLACADLRGVGRCDALNVGTNGVPTYFENRGTRTRPGFFILAPDRDPIAARAAPAQSYDWRPAFIDIDHDGDLDLFAGTRDGTVLFFENRGSSRQPDFHAATRVNPFGLRLAGPLVSLVFGDLDGDGDADCLTANAAGELRYLENRGTAWRPKFVALPAGTLGLTTASLEAILALCDLDADGDLDLIAGAADGRLRYFENLATATISGPQQTVASPQPSP